MFAHLNVQAELSEIRLNLERFEREQAALKSFAVTLTSQLSHRIAAFDRIIDQHKGAVQRLAHAVDEARTEQAETFLQPLPLPLMTNNDVGSISAGNNDPPLPAPNWDQRQRPASSSDVGSGGSVNTCIQPEVSSSPDIGWSFEAIVKQEKEKEVSAALTSLINQIPTTAVSTPVVQQRSNAIDVPAGIALLNASAAAPLMPAIRRAPTTTPVSPMQIATALCRRAKQYQQRGSRSVGGSNTATTKFKCSYPGCDKEFKNKQALAFHSDLHANQRKYKCHLCAKTFTTGNYLYKHYRVHPEMNPFRCVNMSVCAYATDQPEKLRKHMLMCTAKTKAVKSRPTL